MAENQRISMLKFSALNKGGEVNPKRRRVQSQTQNKAKNMKIKR